MAVRRSTRHFAWLAAVLAAPTLFLSLATFATPAGAQIVGTDPRNRLCQTIPHLQLRARRLLSRLPLVLHLPRLPSAGRSLLRVGSRHGPYALHGTRLHLGRLKP